MAWSVCVVGSLALDSVETSDGRATDILGGSAAYFAVAASFLAPVRMVAVTGADFPADEREFLASRGIDLDGVVELDGKTFRWTGRYHDDMNVRDTLDLQLNVFAEFSPELPAAYRTSELVFLANIQPGLQASVLSQLESCRYAGADTMDHWIEEDREELESLLANVQLLSINDSEAALLTGARNMVAAAERIRSMGPRALVIKRGEYGALLFSEDGVFAVPAFPLAKVTDPTGAGDCFAGGMFGSLATSAALDGASLRRAVVYGSVMASFAVEDFGLGRLRNLSRDEIDRRFEAFADLTRF